MASPDYPSVGGYYYPVRKVDTHVCVGAISGQEIVAIEFASGSRLSLLEHEVRAYKALAGGVGIPFVHWSGIGGDYSEGGIVLDLLGPDLENLFNFCQRRFTLKTVLMIADQLFSRIEYIHSRSFIHGDIQPGKLRIGRHSCSFQVNVTGFDLAKKFHGPEAQSHIPHKDFAGSPCYASINTLLGGKQSRRDDMISAAYVLLYFLRGSLPWQGLEYKSILEMKKKGRVVDLCCGLPSEFETYLNYTHSLGLDDRPDYMYVRTLFRDLFTRKRLEVDYAYDWLKYKHAIQSKAVVKPMTSYDFLSKEVEVIEDELITAEHECMAAQSKEQWQELVVLHLALLRLYVDFFLVIQHPSASPKLRQVASENDMLNRMWRHGIQPLFDCFGNYPTSLTALFRAFIFRAYTIVAWLSEAAPEFKDTWIEYCCHLSIYAVEYTNDSRVVWTENVRHWYSKASDPAKDRLSSHLGTFGSDIPQLSSPYLGHPL